MKKILVLAILVFTTITVSAQLFKGQEKNAEEPTTGIVPVVNGKVTFEETIPAEGYTAEEINERVGSWIKERFVKPTVISARLFDSGKPGTTVLRGEEYLVFKSTALVLERARIYYYLTITANDGSCTFNMSRITYWYDDEDDKGGLKMKAEEWITDNNAFNKKGKMKKFEGKFRNKTIGLKDMLVKELKERLVKR